MLTVTPIYAALIAALFLTLSARVIVSRRSNSVSLGDGGQKILLRRIRAQGNCAEYAPIGLILLLIAELQGTPVWFLHVLGLTFVVGRILHGYALTRAEPFTFGRTVGMVLTLVVISIMAVWILMRAVI